MPPTVIIIDHGNSPGTHFYTVGVDPQGEVAFSMSSPGTCHFAGVTQTTKPLDVPNPWSVPEGNQEAKVSPTAAEQVYGFTLTPQEGTGQDLQLLVSDPGLPKLGFKMPVTGAAVLMLYGSLEGGELSIVFQNVRTKDVRVVVSSLRGPRETFTVPATGSLPITYAPGSRDETVTVAFASGAAEQHGPIQENQMESGGTQQVDIHIVPPARRARSVSLGL